MMPLRFVLGLSFVMALSSVPVLGVQDVSAADPPAERRSPTPAQIARRDALALYGLGLMQQGRDRLLDAVKHFEEARTLDPKAPAIHRALVPLYSALGRNQDALDTCRKVLELVPDDHETWYVYARQLKGLGKSAEARTALQRAVACSTLAENVELLVKVQYDLGGLHEDLGEHEQAAAALTTVLGILESPARRSELDSPAEVAALDEQAASTHERIIRLWIQANRHDRAVAAFSQAIRKYPVLAVRLNLPLARVHLAQGQLAEALARLDDFLRTRPVSTEGYELKMTILEKLGRGGEVLPMLEACATRDPHNLALHLLVGRQYARAGRFEQAETFYLALLHRHDGSPDIYRGLLTLYRERKQMDKAFHALNLALARAGKQELLPSDPRAAARGRAMLSVLREDRELAGAMVPVAVEQLNLGRFLHHDTAFFLAAMALRAKQHVAAERLYRHCLEAPIDPPMAAAVQDGLLRVLWELRKYDSIVWLCERGLKQAAGTTRLMLHLNHARALVLLGKVGEGLAEADRAVQVALDDDTRCLARINRLRVLWHAERYEQAVAEGQELLKERLQPAQVRDVRHLLSGIYSTLKDHPKAEQQLQLVLKDDPSDATACNDLGYLWADQNKNLESAERLIRKAIDLDREQKKAAGGEAESDNAAYLDSLGWVLYRRGDLAGARTWLEKAAALPDGSEDPVVWDHLGDVYSEIPDTARAVGAWRKALDLYEKHPRRKADNRSPEIKRKLQR